MRKVGCLFLLLCSTVVFSQNVPQWKVVREYHVIGASSEQGQFPLFTAEGSSLYRATEYISGVSSSVQNAGWEVLITWTDRTGTPGSLICGLNFYQVEKLVCSQPSRPFSPESGTTVSLGVNQIDFPAGTKYDAVVTVEKLTAN
jgi:hypothetical protein